MGRRQADPFNIADVMADLDAARGESVVDDILVVSEDEGEGARRMAVEGGPGQLTAPNVPVAAMKSIFPEVRRQEEGKGGRGQPAAVAAGSGDSSVRTGGRGWTGKGGKGQAGTSAARHAKGHQEGKGGKWGGQGRQWPQPQHSFRQPPPGSPPQVSAAVQAEEEKEAHREQAGRYEVLAHVERQRCRHQPPEPGPDTIYRFEMESGRTGSGRQGGAGEVGRGAQRAAQWRGAERRRSGRTVQRSGGGAPRPAGGRAREWEPARWTHRQRGARQGCRKSRRRWGRA